MGKDRDNEAIEPKQVNYIGHIIQKKFTDVEQAANAAIEWLRVMEEKNNKIVI
jgi:hypothetical protein